MALCAFFIGPAPFLTIGPSVGLIQGCMAICGLVVHHFKNVFALEKGLILQAYGMIVVSSFNRSQKAAIRKGFHDDVDTYHIISG